MKIPTRSTVSHSGSICLLTTSGRYCAGIVELEFPQLLGMDWPSVHAAKAEREETWEWGWLFAFGNLLLTGGTC